MMSMRSKSVWTMSSLAVLSAASFLIAAQDAAAQSLSGREITLGAIVPSSGPFAEWGRTNTVTLKMLEKQVNDAGGVDGAKLKLFVYDDSARPAQATNSLRKLAGEPMSTAEALAMRGSKSIGKVPADRGPRGGSR